ncbi:DinB family protein [Flavivirga algicola]|uniref:DinB family protein n=1 Tax=Flavivirga algicola TaxID=2729136 RepID=A0ABX1RRC7_9FLAO|nr:DinB family protein [Flavivirga algicola]NMH86114.1 DinB family protein [Flavivirga algicola]
MLTTTLIKIFIRDLNKLKTEIKAYKTEENLWLLNKDITNSAGNLCLHIVGNLNHFIGATLGNTGYVRQRDLEFSHKDILRTTLLKQVDDTIQMVEDVLTKLLDENLEKEYPIVVFKGPMSTEYFLVHLATHLSYHLGQINYHRRLLDS